MVREYFPGGFPLDCGVAIEGEPFYEDEEDEELHQEVPIDAYLLPPQDDLDDLLASQDDADDLPAPQDDLDDLPAPQANKEEPTEQGPTDGVPLFASTPKRSHDDSGKPPMVRLVRTLSCPSRGVQLRLKMTSCL